MLAADDGSNSDYSDARRLRIPVLHGSALDQTASFKGGPYSNGYYLPRRGEGCFGWVEVRDDGRRVEIEFTGRNEADAVKVRLKTAV